MTKTLSGGRFEPKHNKATRENSISLFVSASKSLELEWLASLKREKLCLAIKGGNNKRGYSATLTGSGNH